MREILYRGKRTDNSEWVYGDLYHRKICGAISPTIHNMDYTGGSVIPSTVGQYTGLNDKNGKKIFEGDYLKTRALTGEVYVQEVRWTNKFNIVGFRMVDSDEYWDDFDDYEGRIEVVGNIHDDDIEKIKEEVYNA